MNNEIEFVSSDEANLDLLSNEAVIKQNILHQSPILKLNKMSNPSVKTPSTTPQKDEIRILLSAIPEYRPGDNLSIFINEVDNLLNYLETRLTPDVQYIVNFTIRSKIKNEARDFLAYNNANDWPEIRALLLQKYGDHRSEDLLSSLLSQCIQNNKETYLEYHSKLLKAFNDLMQNILLNTVDPDYFRFKTLEYNKLALKTFKNGLIEPYRTFVSNFEINTLEECLNKCRFFDNRKHEWEYSEFLRKSHDNPLRKLNLTETHDKPKTFNTISQRTSQQPVIQLRPSYHYQQKSSTPFQQSTMRKPFFTPQSDKKFVNFQQRPLQYNPQSPRKSIGPNDTNVGFQPNQRPTQNIFKKQLFNVESEQEQEFYYQDGPDYDNYFTNETPQYDYQEEQMGNNTEEQFYENEPQNFQVEASDTPKT